MVQTFSTPFLRNLVDDSYTFFWQAYSVRPRIINQGHKKPAELPGKGRIEEIDRQPPYMAFNTSVKRYYTPLRKNPAMHRTFCDITGNAGIIEFAARYGMLGFGRSYTIRKRSTGHSTAMIIESTQRWKRELAELKWMVHLYDLVKTKRLSLLAALISREKNGIYITLGRRREMIDGSRSMLARKWDRQGEQPLEAALQYLTAVINKKVTGMVSPTMLPDYRKKIYLLPGTLLAAMWLMLLWEVIGETRPRRCPGCGEWFDPKRSTRLTCGDRCRKRKSRQVLKN